jgi:hypothetical protein
VNWNSEPSEWFYVVGDNPFTLCHPFRMETKRHFLICFWIWITLLFPTLLGTAIMLQWVNKIVSTM